MRSIAACSWLGCVWFGVSLAQLGCSSDSKSGPSGASGASSAGSAGAVANGGSAGAQGGANNAGGGQGGSGQAGTDSSLCTNLSSTPGQTGPHGTLALAAQAGALDFISPVGLVGTDIYYISNGNMMHVPAAGGGAPVTVAPFAGQTALLTGTTVVWFESTSTDDTTVRLLTAPITNVSASKVLADGLSTPQVVTVDTDTVFYDSRTPDNIWSIPLAGGTPLKLVPGSSPLGMVSHGTDLYWLDFDSSQLERVPKAGGAPVPLVPVFFGGPMTQDANNIYWADTSENTINRWAIGGTSVTMLQQIPGVLDSPSSILVNGSTVYWSQSFICGSAWQVGSDGSAAQMLVQGFDAPRLFASDSTHLYLGASAGIYSITR
jgi:hypothetical protein